MRLDFVPLIGNDEVGIPRKQLLLEPPGRLVVDSYLLSLKTAPTIDNLAAIFEYTRFVVKKSDAVKLFGNADIDFPEYYEINSAAFKRIDAYAFL